MRNHQIDFHLMQSLLKAIQSKMYRQSGVYLQNDRAEMWNVDKGIFFLVNWKAALTVEVEGIY